MTDYGQVGKNSYYKQQTYTVLRVEMVLVQTIHKHSWRQVTRSRFILSLRLPKLIAPS
jgi:hypothetical protein